MSGRTCPKFGPATTFTNSDNPPYRPSGGMIIVHTFADLNTNYARDGYQEDRDYPAAAVQAAVNDRGLLTFAEIWDLLGHAADAARPVRESSAWRAAAFVLGLLLAVIAVGPRPALADDGIGVVQVTCAPDVGYFAIRRFVLPPFATNEQLQSLLPRLASAHRIYTARQLKAAPADCDLLTVEAGQPDRKRTTRVRAEGSFDGESDSTSPRRITNYVQISRR